MMCVNKRTIPTGAPLATGAFLAEFVGLTHGSNDFAAARVLVARAGRGRDAVLGRRRGLLLHAPR